MKLLHGTFIVYKRPRQLHAHAGCNCSIHVVCYWHNLENGKFGLRQKCMQAPKIMSCVELNMYYRNVT